MVDLFRLGLQPAVHCKGFFALASVTESLHFHAINTIPNSLRHHLKRKDCNKLKSGKPRPHFSGAVANPEAEQLSLLLTSRSQAAVRAAAAFIASVLLKQCYQILQHLKEVELIKDSDKTRTANRKAKPWHLFRRRNQDGINPLARFSRSAASLASKGVEFQKALDPQSAAACFEEALKLAPGNIDYLMFLAKQWSDFSFTSSCPKDERLSANQKALSYAQQILEQDPQSATGYICSCMSKGRLAYWHHDNKQKINLAKEAQEEVITALQLDPNNDLAHHLMGRWHYEMAQLNFVVRSLIRVMYGTSLLPGSVPDALASYQRAAELNPKRLVHRVEVGRMLHKLGHDDEALQQLKEAMQMEVEDINSHINKQEAEELMLQLEKKLRISTPVAPDGKAALPNAMQPFTLPVYALV